MEDEIDDYDDKTDAEENQPIGEVIEDVIHFFRNVNVDGEIGGSMILRILWRNGNLTENGFAVIRILKGEDVVASCSLGSASFRSSVEESLQSLLLDLERKGI